MSLTLLDEREVEEGIRTQSKDESIRWILNLEPIPTSIVSAEVYDEEDLNTDLAETHFDGSATLSSGLIYCPNLHSLIPLHTYRVEVLYSDGSSTLEAIFRVQCTR